MLPWTRMCTEVVLGRLLVWTAHTYCPSSVMSTFSILMVNSSWLRVTRLTLGSTDHLSSPAYSILDRFSHAVCVTTSPCAHLQKDIKSFENGALTKESSHNINEIYENLMKTTQLLSLVVHLHIYYLMQMILLSLFPVWVGWTVIALISKPSTREEELISESSWCGAADCTVWAPPLTGSLTLHHNTVCRIAHGVAELVLAYSQYQHTL